ncbi:MAG: hypothetical protein RSG57_02520 [Christensenellaceae bacterium]
MIKGVCCIFGSMSNIGAGQSIKYQKERLGAAVFVKDAAVFSM